MKAQVLAMMFLMACMGSSVSGFHVKITLQKSSFSNTQNRLTKDLACSRYAEVDKSTLSLPNGFDSVPKPWKNDTVEVVRSVQVINGMNDLLNRPVPGLGGTTAKHVLDYYVAKGCLCFPYGESVRDRFLGVPSNSLDLEVSCNATMIADICKAMWGDKNCKIGNFAANIGSNNEDEVTTDWETNLFSSRINLEYTTNSLAYDSNGNNVVIDLTGNGVRDTCHRNIRIPVSSNDWSMWSTMEKLYRFWILRVIGYKSYDSETMKFIVENTKTEIIADKTSFIKFYCESLLSAQYSSDINICLVTSNSTSVCERKNKLDAIFQTDLGISFWEKEVVPHMTTVLQFTCGADNSYNSRHGRNTDSKNTDDWNTDGNYSINYDNEEEDDTSKPQTTAEIAGGVIGTIFLIIFICCVIGCCICYCFSG